MTLDKTTYKNSLKTAYLKAAAVTDPSLFDSAMDDLASDLADANEVFVKSGLVSTTVTTPDTINGTGTGSIT